MSDPYIGIIKSKGFEPAPVARYGIPASADSVSYPSVEGTVAHEQWWREQIDRCINGYTTAGLFIPGRYYYYLNFCLISTVKRGNHYPDYVDIDLEFFRLVEYIKIKNKGIISLKARRRGLSFKVLNGIIDHGLRFTPAGYSAGVCAGLDTYSVGFFNKLKEANALKPKELQVHWLKDDESELIAGYKENTDTGWIARGSKNRFISKTMNKDPNVFKGERFDDVIFEECGENNHLVKGFGATRDCFSVGGRMVGSPILFGCVCAGTKVWDNYGNLINIEDLNPENGILGYDGKGVSKEKITYWQPPREKKCYRIITNKGRILECSEDHPILWSKKGFNFSPRDKSDYNKRIRSKKAKFVEAKNIKIGEQIAVIESVPIYGKLKMWEPRFIGWLIGDGTYGIDHSPRLSNCDGEINNYVLKNFDAKITKCHITKDGRLYEEIRIKGICYRLREYGIYGQTKLKKRLPKNIHSYTKKDICELLGGFFDTDGHVNYKGINNDRITLTSSSYDLLFEVKLLLQKTGIHCSIRKIKAGFRTLKDINDYYRIDISDVKSIFCFKENISFKIKYKQERLNIICEKLRYVKSKLSTDGLVDGLRFERVISVEPIGMKPVYNLTAGTTNTYIANGIVTHNTGGNIKSSSKGFTEIWEDADSYELVRFEVMGPRLFIGCFGGSRDENGEINEDIPNLQHLTPEQRIGVEDVKRAEEKILAERKRLLSAKNKEKYYDYLQNNPLSAREAFLKFSGNSFDAEALNDQRFAIESSQVPMYSKYILEFVKKEDGSIKYPLEVKAEPATELSKEEDCVLIRFHPLTKYKNLDILAIDSYDLDESRVSKSLGGATLLRRRGHPHKDLEGNSLSNKRIPVCIYRNRPKRKELFYETCLKIAVYYNTVSNTLIDYAKGNIFEYFKRFGGTKYLSARPKSFESEGSEQMHDYGVSINMRSKPQMIGLMQTWIVDEIDQCWFPQMIEELIDYDVVQKMSDWDLADSLGIALMKDADMKRSPVDESIKPDEDPYELPEWKTNADGRMVNISAKKQGTEQIKDPFLRMIENGRLGG